MTNHLSCFADMLWEAFNQEFHRRLGYPSQSAPLLLSTFDKVLECIALATCGRALLQMREEGNLQADVGLVGLVVNKLDAAWADYKGVAALLC